MRTTQKSLNILATLLKVANKHHKHYCYPSQLKILTLLEQYQDLTISRATLNRYLSAMESEKLIRRIRRIRKDKHKGTIFKSTLYIIQLAGYQMLRSVGVPVWEAVRRFVTQAQKVAEKGLAKAKGPISLSQILDSAGMFGIDTRRKISP